MAPSKPPSPSAAAPAVTCWSPSTGPTRRSAASTCRTPRSSPPGSSRSAARSPSPTRPSHCCRTTAFRGGRCAKPLLAAIGDYEAEMVPYGFAGVADSLAQNGSGGNDPLHKPVVGRVMLAATRTYFFPRRRPHPRSAQEIPQQPLHLPQQLAPPYGSSWMVRSITADGPAAAGPTRPCPPRPSHPIPARAAPPVLRALAWLVAPTSPHVREADSSP